MLSKSKVIPAGWVPLRDRAQQVLKLTSGPENKTKKVALWGYVVNSTRSKYYLPINQSLIFKSFSDATATVTATATTDNTATTSAANKTWIYKLFSRNT